MVEEEDDDPDCAEQYEHGCEDCEDYDCLYRDNQWEDPNEA